MDTGYNEAISEEIDGAREFNDVMIELEKTDKSIKNSVVITVSIAVGNIFIGVLATIFPDIISHYLLSSSSMFYPYVSSVAHIIFGLLYLGLTIGINRRNKPCTIIAMAVFTIDTVSGVILGAVSLGIILKVFLIFGLISGINGCFKFNTLTRRYQTSDDKISELIETRKPKKMKTHVIVLYAIVGSIGLTAGIFSVTQIPKMVSMSNNFDSWVEYSFGAVTAKMPTSRVKFDFTAPSAPFSMMLYSATSSGAKGEVCLLRYSWSIGSLFASGQEYKDAGAYEESMLDSFFEELDENWVLLRQSGGIMGGVEYREMRVSYMGNPGAYRCFRAKGDTYIVLIVIHDRDDDDFIGKFFSSLVIDK